MTDVTDRFITESPGGFANVVPRDAATLILLDRSGAMPKVLMGKRHKRHVFLPEKFVFPGGAVDAADRAMRPGVPLEPTTERKLMAMTRRPSRARAQALALAAIRETFEETGLMIGVRRDPPPQAPPGSWADFAAAGVHPDLSGLRFVARAVTPPGKRRRYDTRFFVGDAAGVAHTIEGAVGPDAELTELVWIPLDRAKDLDLLAVTEIVLDDLNAQLEAGFGLELPVPCYRMIRGRRIRDLL